MKTANGFTYKIQKGSVKLTSYTDRSSKYIEIPSHIDGRKVSVLCKNLFQGCNAAQISIPDTIDYVNPSMLYGCYSVREITIREHCGKARFYRTLKTAVGHRTIKLTGEKNTFSLLLKSEARIRFALMWLMGMDIPYPQSCAEDYFFKRSIYILELAAEEDNIPALLKAEELGRVTSANIDRLINKAQTANSSEALAHLMSYKQMNFGFSDIFGDLSKELVRDPFSVGEIKKSFSVKTDDDSCTITGYLGDATDIFIPLRMGKKPITAISEQAFSPTKKRSSRPVYSKLEKIDLNGVTDIGEGAFNGCSELRTAITRSVENIPDKCFTDCSKLCDFNFTGIKSIGAHAFKNCVSLSSIHLPDGLTHIGEWAFFGCSGAKELIFPPSLTTLTELCFGRCCSLKELSLPDGLTAIGKRSFYDCKGVENITFSPSVRTIAWEAFSGCSGISRLHIPGTVKNIGNSAFYYCTGITELILNEGIENIEWGAFNNCQRLTVINLPQSIKKIDSYAFNDCYEIREIHIPPTITDIQPNIFNNCRFVRIYGKKDSYAQEYAWIYGIPFIADNNMR